MNREEYVAKRDEIQNKIDSLIQEMQNLNSEFTDRFIIKFTVGNGDYWDEYYIPYGKAVKFDVDKMVENISDTNEYYDVEAISVGLEQWRLYCKVMTFDQAARALNRVGSEYLETVEKLIDERDKIMKEDLGLEYPSFMHVRSAEEWNIDFSEYK